VQVPALKSPGPVLLKVTAPVGLFGLVSVSVTVTVHALAWLTRTPPGVQLTALLV
jgi:hypothetical protein